MNVTRVVLGNWMRYKGTSRLELQPTVYGLSAHFYGNARRSNWAGKTALVEAIRFALFGVHRMSREDDWITHGEQSGSVCIQLSSGMEITRTRTRGSSTKLNVSYMGDALYGDAAQEFIERHIGLTRADFDATCWFGQKQLSRLVTAKPTERFDLVSGWFNLDPLQRCEAKAKAQLATVLSSIKDLQRESDRLDGAWRTILMRWCPDEVYPSEKHVLHVLRERETELQGLLVAHEAELQAARAAMEELGPMRDALAAKERLAAVITEGKGIAAKLAELQSVVDGAEEVQAAYDAARAEAAIKATKLKEVRSLVRQGFDGKCPVVGFECPAAAKVQTAVRENTTQFASAQDEYDQACRNESIARRVHEERAQAQSTMRALEASRQRLREEGTRLKAKAKDAPDADFRDLLATRNAHLETWLSNLSVLKREIQDCRAAIAQAQSIVDSIDNAREALRAATARLAVYRAAVRIFGRQGAQRALAEAALREIEAGANDILADAAIELSVKVEWSREGSGLAAHCAECGAAFGSSAKIKKCEACGADRGPKLIERLEIELSDRSGAAEDLAGAALQMAAAKWLRRERDVQWGTALIDEPFGALDEAHRKAFAMQLSTMLLGRGGFEQGIIIAHHPEVTDGLPGRLYVRATDTVSTLEVA